MEVKCTRTLREFYKSNIKESTEENRCPHFAGRAMERDGRRMRGFFEMFNGEGDIENKLTTILGMAGDAQAIYEFMQNAVDADGKHFLLSLYRHNGNPYLVVLNDGDYFQLRNLISILAIGDSTKFRSPESIGQFGVGFKLAHRLIGKENSIHELLDENKGPILFSWANGEFAQLAQVEAISTIDPLCSGYETGAISKSTAPWLLKIVATNFPCLPEDEVWDARGRLSKGLFTPTEFEALKGAAAQCYDELAGSQNFQNGTLLLIPLYEHKIDAVIGAVPKGLEIAATIIARRTGKAHVLTTIINRQRLVPAPLEVERWILPESETAGRLGNEVKEAELMLLYADPFGENPFEGKPQFYRYFPMSEEQHGFRFAIHSNALAFASSRTALHKSELNEFLFQKLITLIDDTLLRYAADDTEKFQRLYASLLLSERSAGYGDWKEGREWLEDSLWKPLVTVLKNRIPVREQHGGLRLAEPAEIVYVKTSALPIEKWYKAGVASWFYWDGSAPEREPVCTAAALKLHLKRISLGDVLGDDETTAAINEWLAEAPEHADRFLSELNEGTIENQQRNKIWQQFAELKLWWFGEKVYSIRELSGREALAFYLISYGPLEQAEAALAKAVVLVSAHSLERYGNIERTIRETQQGSLPYLFNYRELNVHLSKAFVQAQDLGSEDKREIFRAIEKAVRDSANTVQRRIEPMKPLALFQNKNGRVLPLEQMIGNTQVPEMLQGWRISEGETAGLNLKDYLPEDAEEIYEQIAIAHWPEIAAQEAAIEQRAALYRYLAESFDLRKTMPQPESALVFYGHNGERENSFYHASLEGFTDAGLYQRLSDAMTVLGIGNLPHYQLLPFYKKAPFALPVAGSLSIGAASAAPLKQDALRVFVKWAESHFPKEVENWLFTEAGNDFRVEKRADRVQHFFVENAPLLSEYAARYFPETLVPLPDFLGSVLKGHVLGKNGLLNYFINHLEQHIESLEELIVLVQDYGTEAEKTKLLEWMPPIDLSEAVEEDSIIFKVLKFCFSIQGEEQRKQALAKLVGLTVNGARVPLADLANSGSDRLEIESEALGKVAFSVSELLGATENSANQMLTQAALQWTELGIASKKDIEEALGIHEAPDAREIWKQLRNTLQGGKLQNGAQYLFALLAGKDASTQHLLVETQQGWQDFNKIYFLESAPYLPKNQVLSERYSQPTLALLGKKPGFTADESGFLVRPYLKGGDFQMPCVASVPRDIRSVFWKTLYESWKEGGQPENLTLNGTNDWKPFLGYNPQEWILDPEFALEEEQPSLEKLTHYGIAADDLPAFLQALGAQGEDGPVIKARRYFQNRHGHPETLSEAVHIRRLLQWLYEKQLPVHPKELTRYYQNLAGREAHPEFFPGFVPGNSEMRMLSIVADAPLYVSPELKAKILERHISFNRVADASEACLLAPADWHDNWQEALKKLPRLTYKSRHFDELAAQAESTEWDAPYYQEWKKQYPHFKIRLLFGKVPYQFLVNGKQLLSFHEGDYAAGQDTNIVYVCRDCNAEKILSLLDVNGAFTAGARQALREALVRQEVALKKYLDLAKRDPNFLKSIEEHAQKAEAVQEKKAAIRALCQKEDQYKLHWFQDLLHLVRRQESQTAIPEIIFRKCRLLPDGFQVYELSEYEGRIPANLGSYERIEATICYKDTDGQLKECKTAAEADQKYQKVRVYFPETKAHTVLQHPVVSVRLTFSKTVNLIQELENGFERLNKQPDANLKDTLSENIDFLFGPPGTGKTTTLARRILEDVEAGLQGPTIVLTPTNKAADVLTKKILELSGNTSAPDWLVRAGTCTEPSLLQSSAVKNLQDVTISANSNVVFITTIHRFCYFQVFSGSDAKSRLSDCPWRKVIFDEASMIPLAYIIHAIHARQKAQADTQFLVAGDPLQIPPVFDLDLSEADDDADEMEDHSAHNIYSMIGLRSFDPEIQKDIPKYGHRIENLTIQHRSVPEIGQLFSQFQYGGRIHHSRGTASNQKPATSRPLPEVFRKFGFKPITIIRYPVRSGDTIYNPQKLQKSPLHVYVSLLVSELIKKFKTAARPEGGSWSLGVLSPYRSQADLLQKMIEGHKEKPADVIISTDTVHGFQGDENAMVFAILNPSSKDVSYSRFLKKEFILNVAISRAEDYLVLFVPDEDSKGIEALSLLNQIMNITRSLPPDTYAFLDALELEEQLMNGKRRYFELNSFSTAHQKVNVYGVPLMPYTIRINNDSLDVHWSEAPHPSGF